MESRRLTQLSLHLGVALLGVVFLNALVFWVIPDDVPHRYVEGYDEERRAIASQAETLDVVFLGTSRLDNGISPEAFEQAAAELGWQVHTYNASVDNLNLPEQSRVVDDLFAIPGFHPELVILEPAFRLGRDLQNVTSTRSVYFNDLRGFELSLRTTLSTRRRFIAKAYNTSLVGLGFAIHGLNYGRLSDAIFPGDRRPGRNPLLDDALARRGHSHGEASFGASEARASFLSSVSGRADEYRALAAQAAESSPALPPAEFEIFAGLAQRVREHGAEPLYVLPPKYVIPQAIYRDRNHGLVRSAQLAPAQLPLLSYLDHAAAPELYAQGHWVDMNHLDSRGARIFSRRLARDVVRWRAAAEPQR